MIRAILVDDEAQSREALSAKLKRNCPQVVLLEQCASAGEGIEAIARHTPDLVFLDIEMPVMNGFSMLETIGNISFDVIFTTAYDQYAIRAIRFSALDYLLKPVDVEELKQAVAQHEERIRQRQTPAPQHQLAALLQDFRAVQGGHNKIALPTSDGYQLVQVREIVRVESDNNYCVFYFSEGKKFVVSRTLKEYEELLEEYNFCRVHNSHLVNMQYVNRYMKGEGGYVIMDDGTSIEVSVRRKPAFLQQLTRG